MTFSLPVWADLLQKGRGGDGGLPCETLTLRLPFKSNLRPLTLFMKRLGAAGEPQLGFPVCGSTAPFQVRPFCFFSEVV